MKTATTYDDALDYLYSFIDYEHDSAWKYNTEHFDLSRFRDFLCALGNPHEQGRFVHVAGTNGKGSVAAMIASALSESGMHTGLYTSPHLITFRERIRINGTIISPDEDIDTVKRIKEASQRFDGLTFFEIWTALALHYFAEQKIDVSVIEVGLGGRLDSTNVINPDVSVITSIAVDHRGKLGDSPEQIAREKAGIIKQCVPVVSAPQEKSVGNVLEEKAKKERAEFYLVGRDMRYDIVNSSINYSGLKWRINNVAVPLNGIIQCENAAVALAALEVLEDSGYPVADHSARMGIGSVKWPGRLQKVSSNPGVFVDGACNAEAMKAVADYISTLTDRDRVVAVVGMCSDKDVEEVLDMLGKAASRFVLTQVVNPRAMMPHELAARSPGSVETIVQERTSSALERAVSLAGGDGLVIATGSLYLVGEVLRYYGAGEHD